jgi:hypothetical protein
MMQRLLRGLWAAGLWFLASTGYSADWTFDTLRVSVNPIGRETLNYVLPEVPVDAGMWRTQSQATAQISPRALGLNASALLAAGLDLRQSVPGGSAWLALDGLPSTHTWIEWEGLALQASDLGIMDVRLLPSTGLQLERSADGLRLRSSAQAEFRAEAASLGNAGLSVWLPGQSTDLGVNVSSALNRFAYHDFLGQRQLRLGAGVQRAEVRTAWRRTQSALKQDGAAYLVVLQQGLPEAVTQVRRKGAVQRDLRATVVQRQTLQSGRVYWQSMQYATLTSQRYDYKQFGGIHDTNRAQSVGIRMRAQAWVLRQLVSSSVDASRLMAQGPNKDPASVLRVQAMLRGTGLLPGKLRYHWGLSHLSQGSEAGRMLPMLQLSAAEKASTQWSLKAHRHQRFPTLNDLFWVPGGNPMLRAELGWEVRASLNRKSAGTELYHGRLADAIVWMPVGTVWTPRNVASITRWGGSAHLDWKRGAWSGMFRAQAVRSVNDLGLRVPYVAPWSVSALGARKVGSWTFRAEPRFRAATPTAWSSDRSTWLPAQGQIDVHAQWSMKRSALEISLYNATNSPMLLQLGYPLPGRYLGISWSTPISTTPKSST